MKYLVFDEETKAAVIGIETLDRTIKLEDAGGGLPAAAPIEHVNLIKLLMKMADEMLLGYKAELQPIIIKKNNCKRIQFKGEAEECPVENYLIERLVAKIIFVPAGDNTIDDFDDIPNAKGNMAIGISYNERGIQIAFGHHVSVCQNMNVFGDTICSTYGDGAHRVTYDQAIEMYHNWLSEFEEVKRRNAEMIAKLMDTQMSKRWIQEIIGMLFFSAVLRNEGHSVKAPLNITECAKMVRAGIPAILEINDVPISAWELTNWATSVLKAETSDMIHLLTKIAELNEFILKEIGA